MIYEDKKEWTKAFLKDEEMPYPAEYVIRIFKGSYPRLNLDKSKFQGKKICDIGCGTGRNMYFLRTRGFDVHGVEITEPIVDKVRQNLKKAGVDKAEVRVGTNDNIPFEDGFFDYLLSWNACYYMGDSDDFGKHVRELSRVLKKGGYLIMSIPQKTCYYYEGSETLKKGYRIIRNDPFNVRNGAVLRIFEDVDEIKEEFSGNFENFVTATDHDDCFGLNYHLHMIICQKK
ncbi:MAG: class I SAM-dependent methyltransferase [Candidatus Omnitrophota bacterium]|nr:class I SAM-dependent methyltransferase [Candidatus Omnitrophota bacterium]